MATLKQSTSYTRTFMMIQTSDHITGITGATVTVLLSKAGGAGAAAGGVVSQVDATNNPGLYKIVLTTTDTATLGDLSFHCTATSADPTDFIDQVTANILGDNLPANVTQWNGTNVSAPATAGIPDVNVKNIAAQTASAAAGVTFPASIASPTNITAGTITTTTNLTNAPTAGDFTATMKTSIGTAVAASAVASVTGNVGGNVTGSVGSVVGAVGSVTGAVGSVTGNVGGNVTGSIGSLGATAKTDVSTAVLTTTMTEAYPVKGSTFTLAAGIYNLVQELGERAITSTTVTILKRDQATTAKTYTLNSASNPTASTEAS